MITFTHVHKKILLLTYRDYSACQVSRLHESHDISRLILVRSHELATDFARLLKKSSSKKLEMWSCFSPDGRQKNIEIIQNLSRKIDHDVYFSSFKVR